MFSKLTQFFQGLTTPTETKASPPTLKLSHTVYLLPDNQDQTFAQAHELVTKQTQGYNAILLFPDSESHQGVRQYNARVIRNGRWEVEAKKIEGKEVEEIIKETSIGKYDFKNVKLMVPNTLPKDMIKIVYARLGLILPPIFTLGPQVLGYTLPEMHDSKTLVSFAESSFLANHVSQPGLKKSKIKKLLNHVIHGEQAQAEKLLQTLLTTHPDVFPSLFETKLLVTDYSGRHIEGTAFQLALGAEDVKYHENEECMAEMLARYIKRIPQGEAMLATQCQEQFPQGWELKAAAEAKNDTGALDQIFTVLQQISEEDCQSMHDVDDNIQKLMRTPKNKTHDPDPLKQIVDQVLHADKDKFDIAFNKLQQYILDNKLIPKNQPVNFHALKAIYQFRHYLESSTKEVIKSGKHFNVQLLIEALKLYDENYANFGGHRNGDPYNSAKNLVAWRKIVGYIQRFVPACLGQAIAQGVYYITDENERLKRSFAFRFDPSYKFFPLNSEPSFSLGFDYADGGAGVVGGGWRCGARSGRGGHSLFQNLCRAKTSTLQSLCNSLAINRSTFNR